jgi:hypothetical protein
VPRFSLASDPTGKRFVDELDTRDKVSQAIFENCKPLIVEQEVSTLPPRMGCTQGQDHSSRLS